MEVFDKSLTSQNDFITTDKFLSLQDESPEIDYTKTDAFYLNAPFLWRDKIHYKNEKGNKILITGHSDYPITLPIYNTTEHLYKTWFALNIEVDNDKLQPIPLGLGNYTHETYLHQIGGNVNHIIQARLQPFHKKYLCYLNLSVNTYYERQFVYDYFKNYSWVFTQKTEHTNEGRIQFLMDMRHSKFILCPRGNGIDTHRLWEALYVGAIPIVKKHINYKNMLDLPILFIDNWEEVTESFLENKYIEIINKNWNYDKLNFSYWKKLIFESL